MSDFAPVIAAIIIGTVTLLTVLINVASAQIVYRQEQNGKHQEWIRDKQVQDIEEIVPTLSRFLSSLSDCLEGMEARLNSAYMSIENLPESRQHGLVGVNLEFMRDFLKDYEKDLDILWQLDTERRAWFEFEAKRRSIWFNEPDVIELQINNIGQLLRDFHLSIHKKSSAFRWIVKKVVSDYGNITEADAARVEDLKKSLLYAFSTWPEINRVVTNFQKTLVSGYKPARPDNRPTLDEDGLLVRGARWTEKKLRQLLQLR